MPTVRSVRVFLARVQQSIGWTGLVGLALIAAAGLVFGLAWSTRTAMPALLQPTLTRTDAKGAPQAASPKAPSALPDLAPASEVPLLLTQIKQIAVANGLGWAAADYRIVPASDTQPASLEVRSGFKAPYPKLRKLVSQVLTEVPAATLRELSFSRNASDVAEVDGKLTIAVLLWDEPGTPVRTRVNVAP